MLFIFLVGAYRDAGRFSAYDFYYTVFVLKQAVDIVPSCTYLHVCKTTTKVTVTLLMLLVKMVIMMMRV